MSAQENLRLIRVSLDSINSVDDSYYFTMLIFIVLQYNMKHLFYISEEEEGATEGKRIYTMHIYVNLIIF